MSTVFISFLGAIPYQSTQYGLSEQDKYAEATPFVQEAILNILAERGTPVKQVFIFTTKDAALNNYHNRIKAFNQATGTAIFDESAYGLEKRLTYAQNEGKVERFEAVLIPDGNTEAEIFKVFEILYGKLSVLPVDTRVIFDITFGFRSLPLLCIVLLNYVRTLNNIQVQHIFYGNFEVGRHLQQQQTKQMQVDGATEAEITAFKALPTKTPILDLRSFADLQEWTSAARVFLEGGNAKALSALMPEDKKAIGDQILSFTDQILTCRGREFIARKDIQDLKTAIVSLQSESNIEAQLKPILEKIEQKLSGFSNETSLNGFAAVKWCLQHQLIQQGYTFLEETCKSFLIEKLSGLDKINHPKCRESAGTALNDIPEDKYWHDKIDLDLTKKMKDLLNTQYPDVTTAYKKMTGYDGLRNDINHCGYQKKPKAPEKLRAELESIYQELMHAFHIPT
jgi:CRISPR-associated Csx2 family protein